MECSNKKLFPGQKTDEKIVLFVRRHLISFLPTVFLTFLMMVLPIVILSITINNFMLTKYSNLFQYFVLGSSAYILFILTFFIVNWIDYYFDILIITDSRLVNIEQNGLFNRQISQVDLLRVQDVSTSVKGIIPTMFNYGSVVVQTAGESNSTHPGSSDFTMLSLPNPQHIAQTILRLNQELIGSHGQSTGITHGEGEIYPSDNLQKEHKSGAVLKNDSYQAAKKTSNIQDTTLNKSVSVSAGLKIEGQLKEGETIDL